MIFGKNKLVFIVNLIRHDFRLWNIPTISVNAECRTITFPYKYVISILTISFCKSKICCSQIQFVNFYRSRRELQRLATIMLQAVPKFNAEVSEKTLSTSTNTYEKYIVCKDYCIAHHEDRTCFLPACKTHIILLGEIEELIHKLDTFCFTFQHVDCLYALFKFRFSKKNYC